MPQVYLDNDGAVRSTASDKVIAPAGTTVSQARMNAALWAATVDLLSSSATAGTDRRPARAARAEGMPAVAAPTPISAAPSYARTVGEARRVLTVIDIEQLADETAQELAVLGQRSPR
ncbi:MAG: hypothetical protein ACI39C_07275 [Dietzia sp.]